MYAHNLYCVGRRAFAYFVFLNVVDKVVGVAVLLFVEILASFHELAYSVFCEAVEIL